MWFKNHRKEVVAKEVAELPKIIVNTSYGSLEIVDLKRIWVNEYFGTYGLMYQDSIYKYNCIYWSDYKSQIQVYEKMREKILDAYNRGDRIVEV